MRYSGIQPQYFPRLHYFSRILNADIFVLRDDCQFVRKHKYPNGRVDKSYQAHTPIKQILGPHLLLVPTLHQGLLSLQNTQISYNHDWIENHLKTLQVFYNKSSNFERLYPEIKLLLNTRYQYLADLNNATIYWGILKLLQIKKVTRNMLSLEFIEEKLRQQNIFRLKKIKRASESQALNNNSNLKANEKIIALCQEFGASEDYCGETGVKAYMDHQLFKKNRIKVTIQNWKCQNYPQLFPQHGFIPNLSIIDLLMNVPQTQAADIING